MADRAMKMLLVVVLSVSVFGASGCQKGTGGELSDATRSEELTPGEFPQTDPASPVEPPPPMLKDPKTSVFSYLVWISYAYRILNSEVATPAFSAWEEVRVNSYVELNRQEGRAIDQRLVGFEIGDIRTKGNTATVTAREDWLYRYISIKSAKYSSPVNKASYDTTYTVVKTPGKGWLVDDVEAKPIGGTPE